MFGLESWWALTRGVGAWDGGVKSASGRHDVGLARSQGSRFQDGHEHVFRMQGDITKPPTLSRISVSGGIHISYQKDYVLISRLHEYVTLDKTYSRVY
jgi:hypothetical protein